ncbi:MAG: hypothetical protein IJ227_02780, partial [Mogibacterium sp.]|nr:hypothetical protein [Mogibacterium sp.]
MADHTGKKKENRRTIDTHSIKTTILVSFFVFALFLLAVLWGLTNFFLNSYYERARTQEVISTAASLETQLARDVESFDSLAVQTAGANGIYIRLDAADGS